MLFFFLFRIMFLKHKIQHPLPIVQVCTNTNKQNKKNCKQLMHFPDGCNFIVQFVSFFVVVGSLCFLQTRAQYIKGSEFRLRLHRPPLFFVIYWVLLGMGRLRNGRWSVPCKQIAPCNSTYFGALLQDVVRSFLYRFRTCITVLNKVVLFCFL